MRLLAPAKINLHLRVGPLASDGFHPLLSWFCTIGLFDTLTLKLRSRASGSREHQAGQSLVRLETDFPDLPVDERNLVVRAGSALADTPGRRVNAPAARREGVSVFLEKRIPMGAGLGGGSSDAACALLGLNNLWGIGWSAQRLSEFSAQFGSDVPFFLHGPSAICRGRGEIVRSIAPPAVSWGVLVLPAIHMPTPAVYRRFDEMKLGRQEIIETEPDWNAWTQLTSEKLLACLVNDLEAPAFSISPELARLHQAVERRLRRIVRMSGSGSSLFTLFDSRDAADESAERIAVDLKVQAKAVRMAPEFSDDLNV
jgi:4-diphosphocytidyl-2-C-methyl-D-erythritol kinase